MTRKADTDRVEAARKLAASHYDAEPRLVQIIHFSSSVRIEARPAEPIKLLEVNTAAVAARRLVPAHFEPCPSIPFAVELIDVTPDQYDQILAKRLRLPSTWLAGVDIPKPDPDVRQAAESQRLDVGRVTAQPRSSRQRAPC